MVLRKGSKLNDSHHLQNCEVFDISTDTVKCKGMLYKCVNGHWFLFTSETSLHGTKPAEFDKVKKEFIFAWKLTPFTRNSGSILSVMLDYFEIHLNTPTNLSKIWF